MTTSFTPLYSDTLASPSGASSFPSLPHVIPFNFPTPNSVALRQWKEGMLPCCAPSQPPVALLWTSFIPLLCLPPTLHSPTQPLVLQPHLTLQHPSTSRWAGDRPLNEGPGVPDGSYRWTVVIGPIDRCHRLLPAKTQKAGYITSKKKEKEREREQKRKRAEEKVQARG